jgi:hypothetical protein
MSLFIFSTSLLVFRLNDSVQDFLLMAVLYHISPEPGAVENNHLLHGSTTTDV